MHMHTAPDGMLPIIDQYVLSTSDTLIIHHPKIPTARVHFGAWAELTRCDLDLPCGHAAQYYGYLHNEYDYHTNSMQRLRGIYNS